jgi:hypothetical protein
MGPQDFSRLLVSPKTGSETFRCNSEPVGMTLLDFWRWSASDLASNTTRGVLAEFIVATALDLTEGTRVELDAFELTSKTGAKIEVKSSAYAQSWSQRRLSAINFSIRPTRFWNEDTGVYDQELKRQADIYIFCLLSHTDKATIDPLNLDQWDFYLLPARVLNEQLPTQAGITLSRLLQLAPTHVKYSDLRVAIETMTN